MNLPSEKETTVYHHINVKQNSFYFKWLVQFRYQLKNLRVNFLIQVQTIIFYLYSLK